MTESRGTPGGVVRIGTTMPQPTLSFRFQLAMGSLEDSLFAADTERRRLSEDELKSDWQTDATFFVFALRNLLRSGELAARSAPSAVANDIRRTLKKFKEAVPELVDLRDVLEHFDDYLEMKGKLQHPPGTPAMKRKPEAAIDRWDGKRKRRAPPGSFGFWAVRQDGDLLIGAGELELRVEEAFRAAQDLASAILAHRPER